MNTLADFYKMLSEIEWLKVLPIIISTITFILAYLAYKKFITRQVISKQIEHVSNLVNDIQKIKISLKYNSFQHGKGSYHTDTLSLFEISHHYHLKKDNKIFKKLNNIVKYQDDDFLLFLPYGYHPLTPKKIADIIVKFQDIPNPRIFIFDRAKNDNKIEFLEILGSGSASKYFNFCQTAKDEEEFNAFVSNGEAFESYLAFLKCTYDLKNEIISWFKKIGIEDINIRSTDRFEFYKR